MALERLKSVHNSTALTPEEQGLIAGMDTWGDSYKLVHELIAIIRRLDARVGELEKPLGDEAYNAISVEHERDHSDGPAELRKGCLGCRLLREIARLTRERDALARVLEGAQAQFYEIARSCE